MNKAIYEAIAEVLAEHRKIIAGDVKAIADELKARVDEVNCKPPLRGVGIKAVDLHEDGSAFDLVFDNDDAVTIPLPQPQNGKDASPQEIAKALINSPDFMAQVKGKPGNDADPVLIAKELASDANFVAISKGEKGEQGLAGADGLDCPVIDLTVCKAGQSVERGALVKHRGGIWQAVRKANGTPDDEPTAYRLAINGIAGVNLDYDFQRRELTINVESADDSRATISIEDVPRFINPSEKAKNVAGDHYFEGSVFKFVDSSGDWHEIDLRGDRGRTGKRGVGIVGIKMLDSGVMEFDLSNNETIAVDFMPAMLDAVKTAFGDLIEQFFKTELDKFKAEIVAQVKKELRSQEQAEPKNAIKRFAGQWRSDITHKAGDVVNAAQGLFLAKRETNAPVLTGDWECLIPSTQSPIIGI